MHACCCTSEPSGWGRTAHKTLLLARRGIQILATVSGVGLTLNSHAAMAVARLAKTDAQPPFAALPSCTGDPVPARGGASCGAAGCCVYRTMQLSSIHCPPVVCKLKLTPR